VIGIVTGYGLDDRGVGVRVPVEKRIFSTSSRPALGSTQHIQWVQGNLSQGVKRPGREADHSAPASAEVKTMDLYIHFPIRLHATGTLPTVLVYWEGITCMTERKPDVMRGGCLQPGEIQVFILRRLYSTG
jgi:hypothetical protein